MGTSVNAILKCAYKERAYFDHIIEPPDVLNST